MQKHCSKCYGKYKKLISQEINKSQRSIYLMKITEDRCINTTEAKNLKRYK